MGYLKEKKQRYYARISERFEGDKEAIIIETLEKAYHGILFYPIYLTLCGGCLKRDGGGRGPLPVIIYQKTRN